MTASYPNHPRGYRENPKCPVLHGKDHCPHCLCAPCVIAHPPEFLRGACGVHPANEGKRDRLYSMYWKVLSDLELWSDDEYLARKKKKKGKDTIRDIIPECIITVSLS